ncbi:MAG: hypothetical protein ACO388_01680 [Saprospiraceae bacterium]|jgi:hypothetical protein
MKSVVFSLLFFGFFMFSLSVKAQDVMDHAQEKEAVQQVIENLFEAMRKNNGVAIEALFHPEMVMKTIGVNEQGGPVLKEGSAQGFIDYVSQERPENTLDERLTSVNILVDGPLAMAWTPYEFYASGDYSHCGVNVFKLLYNGKKWQIFSITDTRRKTNCPE